MNAKFEKKLRKYAQLRGAKYEDNRFNVKLMKKIYLRADEDLRKQYREEIDNYIQAVDDGRIEAGESLIQAAFKRKSTPASQSE